MQIPILVESVGESQFRAAAPPPFNCSAEGKSSAEAISNLRAQMQEALTGARRVVLIDLPIPDENPWIQFAGHLKDDSYFDDWNAALAEYRQKRNPTDL